MRGRLIEGGQERSSGVSGGIFGKVMLRGVFFSSGVLFWAGVILGPRGGGGLVRGYWVRFVWCVLVGAFCLCLLCVWSLDSRD